ncbi:uncharacterized protein B0P05DRAFT_538895 [Gilbertella persicaria]|uniref:Ornithine decarboxylase antizyme n=1 Tax=Rhizopus stolonifer TaxID=4846 RepID=A0A367KW93_RHIST|nr:uncharacterized protein B0P05DRAFT_538895 [Gilbertella persicaria]KAI8081985.1 hypothetical protein B0P05DRAFT_538895 [Gilbertella persicaria]RCI06427.1 hypothetical protein CU098_003997 [Rhizopus stolonifer]
MIIASAAKKEIPIPLQPMTSTVSSNTNTNNNTADNSNGTNKRTLRENVEEIDLVTINSRHPGQNDFIAQVFGQTSVFNAQVEETLTITTKQTGHAGKCMKSLTCESFIHNDVVFLSSPFVGNHAGLLNWADGEFQSCITHLIELAEEKTGCHALVVWIDKHQYKDSLSTILRAFMYLGFEMVVPGVYGQEPGYVLVGYEF